MSDNPFLEPDDSERTVIRPTPGGRRPPAPAQETPRWFESAEEAPARLAAASAGDGVETVAMGVNPLVAAAAPLLQLMARLPNTINHPDPGELRERAVRAMHT